MDISDTTSPPKFRTANKYGKKRARKVHLAMARKQRNVAQSEAILDDSSGDSDSTIIMVPSCSVPVPGTSSASRTETKLKAMTSALPEVDKPTKGMVE